MDLLETAATEVESLAIPEPQDATFATIDKIFDDGVTLIFDGQEAATEKHYKVNSFAIFKEQDRVRIIKDSGTYVVEYTVGKPKKTFNADTADSATTAQTAESATTAQTAQSATTAESATKAESAESATTAETATNADSATNATSAEKAAALVDAASSNSKVYLKISSSKLYFGSGTTSMYEVPKLGLPTGGSSGQVLVKNGSSDGAAGWSTLTGLLPEGGSANQILAKDSSTDHDVSWKTIGTLPTGGSTGQCLVKDSATNYDVSWGSPSVPKLYVDAYNNVTLNDDRQLVPHTYSSYSSSYAYSLGSSSLPWTNLYIGRGVIKLGDNASYTTIGFFGTTPQSRKTLSTYSTNMDYSSASESNYLTILNNVVGILKKYGLLTT